ncbi:vWA domain-containing protein [Vagococcus bubulae]|uniref:VWFA domain-containing protein n=1 Tax=Vagococcus bubulae TaxID=1977868 RepID=A0A429ZBZ3_9ENTE|nr:vWA domain-containing protein [Vagococcus bubulae]RST91204.1 hypothetical protein CBF36_10295 [Vagococcus bubulae]
MKIKYLLVFILLMTVCVILPTVVDANQNDLRIITDTPELKIDYETFQNDENIHWKIKYNKNNENRTKLRFKVGQSVQVIPSDNLIKETDSNDYIEAHFNLDDYGSLEIISQEDIQSIPIEIELIKETEPLQTSVVADQILSFNEMSSSPDDKSPPLSTSLYETAYPMYLNITEGYNDPFYYIHQKNKTNQDNGIYPHNGTYDFISDNRLINQKNTVKNFNFGKNYDPSPKTLSIDGKSINFINGYHNYIFDNDVENGNVLTKKIVKPTDDPTKFDIELDIIGGSTKTLNKVDVVFVVDKSSSMIGDRWATLQKTMKRFSEGLFGDNDVQMGLVSYGSLQNPWNYTHIFSDLANFSTSNYQERYFTKSSREIVNHPIVSKSPEWNSGTPTFIGVDMGVKLLTNPKFGSRVDAKKYLIVLTDGEATFAPNTRNFDSYDLWLDDRQPSNIRRYYNYSVSKTIDRNYQVYGTGSTSQNLSKVGQDNASLINQVYSQQLPAGTKAYSIGFDISKDSTYGVLDAIGTSGTYTATSEQDMNSVLDNIKKSILTTNYNVHSGKLNDPMSEYVSLTDISKVKLTGLSLTQDKQLQTNNESYIKDVVVSIDSENIVLSNLHLGSDDTTRHGIRLNYQVQLKKEYQDGDFYPTNGPTFAFTKEEENVVGFAVPSVRVIPEKKSIKYKKIWNDDNNSWKLRKNISFELQKREKNSNADWETVSNQSIDEKTLQNSNEYQNEFKDVIFKVGNTEYEYRIVELNDKKENDSLFGYKPTQYSSEIITKDNVKNEVLITNILDTLPIVITKVGEDGQTGLSGASFSIYKESGTEFIEKNVISDHQGKVKFLKELPVGKYILKENTSPTGYEKIPDISFEVIQDEKTKSLSIQGLPKNHIVINKLKDFSLRVEKVNQYNHPVRGVKFKLTDSKNTYSKELSSDEDHGNIFTFKGLRPGTYFLEETKNDSNHVLLEKKIEIVILSSGAVKIDGKLIKDVLEHNNEIVLTVSNTVKGLLPSTGGNGISKFKILGASLLFISLFFCLIYFYKYLRRIG